MAGRLDELMPEADELFAAAMEHRLVLPRCARCRTFRFPPRLRCPECGALDTEWMQASGKGTVYSYAVVHQKLHPAFDALIPYAVALVTLEEGPRMLTLLIDTDPAAVAIGAQVEVAFEHVDDVVIPRMRLCR